MTTVTHKRKKGAESIIIIIKDKAIIDICIIRCFSNKLGFYLSKFLAVGINDLIIATPTNELQEIV